MLHHHGNYQIENIIKYAGRHQRSYGGLGRRYLLGDGKHLRHGKHKGQGGILYQRYHFICHRREHPLNHLGQNDFYKGLRTAVARILAASYCPTGMDSIPER